MQLGTATHSYPSYRRDGPPVTFIYALDVSEQIIPALRATYTLLLSYGDQGNGSVRRRQSQLTIVLRSVAVMITRVAVAHRYRRMSSSKEQTSSE